MSRDDLIHHNQEVMRDIIEGNKARKNEGMRKIEERGAEQLKDTVSYVQRKGGSGNIRDAMKRAREVQASYDRSDHR